MIACGKFRVMIGCAKLGCAFGTDKKQGDHIITFAKQAYNGERK